MSLQNITLFSFGRFEKDFLEKIAESVKLKFHCEVFLREGHIDLGEHFDASRRQYNGNTLLKQMDIFSQPDSFKALGLFNVDLYIPILTYIFGQAFLNGHSGIASMYRLDNRRYGMEKNDQRLIERFKKEVIHELGHTYGLIHCHELNCVMKSSTYLEDIDQKTEHLCHNCRAELGI